MTPVEFSFVVAWLLLPPLLLGSVVFVLIQRRSERRRLGRNVQAWLLLLALSILFCVALVAMGPSSIGRHIGVRDAPFLWAPAAFIAVALAFPLSVWWARRDR